MHKLYLPINQTYLVVAETIDANKNVLSVTLHTPSRTMSNLKLLAKSYDNTFHEIIFEYMIAEKQLYGLKLTNGLELQIYEGSYIFDYNTKTFKPIEQALDTKIYCDIVIRDEKQNNAVSITNNQKNRLKVEDDLIGFYLIQFAKAGKFPCYDATTKTLINKPKVYENKQISVIDVINYGMQKNIIVSIEREKPVINAIFVI